jgi:hypothetical protein
MNIYPGKAEFAQVTDKALNLIITQTSRIPWKQLEKEKYVQLKLGERLYASFFAGNSARIPLENYRI